MNKTLILLVVIVTGFNLSAYQKGQRVYKVNDAQVQEQTQVAPVNNAQFMPLAPYMTTQTSEFIAAMTVILLFLNSIKDNKLASLTDDSQSLQGLTKTVLFLAAAGCVLKVGLDCSAGLVHFLSRVLSKGIIYIQRYLDQLLYGKERFDAQQLLIWECIFNNTASIIEPSVHNPLTSQRDAAQDWIFVQQVVDIVFSRIIMYIECASPYYQKSIKRRHASCIDNDATIIFIATLLVDNLNHLKMLVEQADTLQTVQTEHCKKIIEHTRELFNELRYILADHAEEYTYVVEMPVMQETLQSVVNVNGMI